MTTARNIIKNRIRAGNTLLGVGCYSAAILPKNTSNSRVIKVGNTVDDPWLEYYEYAISKAPDNPYFPKIHDLHIDYQHDYYVAVVEKLDSAFDNSARNESLEGMIADWCKDGIDLQSLQMLTIDHEVDSVCLHEAVNAIHRIYTDGSEPAYDCDGDCEAAQAAWNEDDCEWDDYDCSCTESVLNIDLHCGNFMYRENGDLVINDPLCHSNMEDVDDIVNWADEHLPQSPTNV
jgi:hypothetical protein